MDEFDLKIGRTRLERVMQLREISGAELARRIGVHAETIQKVKQSETTTLKRIGEISKALGCHPFDLLVVAEEFPEPFLAASASH